MTTRNDAYSTTESFDVTNGVALQDPGTLCVEVGWRDNGTTTVGVGSNFAVFVLLRL